MKKWWLLQPLRTIAGEKGLATSGRKQEKNKRQRKEEKRIMSIEEA
jgi:hypothetical protein